MSERRSTRLSPEDAFGAQGVVLRDPASSRSGVRTEDGMVLFAVRAEEVIADAAGSRCLLWSGSRRRAAVADSERLAHCILAWRQGQAEGLLAFADGSEVDPTLVLSLRVERRRGEYWAKWGSAARESSPWCGQFSARPGGAPAAPADVRR